MFIIRRAQDHVGMYRDLKVTVDGELVGRLRPGNEVGVHLPDGHHLVQARMDWCTSSPLDISLSEREKTSVEVAMPFTSIPLFFFKSSEAIEISVAGGLVDESGKIRRSRLQVRATILLLVMLIVLFVLAVIVGLHIGRVLVGTSMVL